MLFVFPAEYGVAIFLPTLTTMAIIDKVLVYINAPPRKARHVT